MQASYQPRPPGISFNTLPREVIRNIAGWIYDPLEVTQQDRLTWGIFSTVDMHQQRQSDLESLVRFGWTCRRVRREVRVILFRCIRTPTRWHAEEVVRSGGAGGWAKYVRSIIIDLSMFDPDCASRGGSGASTPISPHALAPKVPTVRPETRSCWSESTTLINMFNCLPSLEHVSFFADASDDTTLALTFAALIPHPSLHAIPPSTVPPSPAISTLSIAGSTSGLDHLADPPSPSTTQPKPVALLANRLKSFGWRQRACPPSPSAYRQFHQSTVFASTLHLLRHAYQLSFLVLDADMDVLRAQDVQAVLKELNLREAPAGEEVARVSLMLCGPIMGWVDNHGPNHGQTHNQSVSPTSNALALGQQAGATPEGANPPGGARGGGGFLSSVVAGMRDVEELFLDRPLMKSTGKHIVDEARFLSTLSPLFHNTPHLHLLQIGSYTFPQSTQISIAQHLAREIPSLMVLGLNGEEGDTTWWAIWRSHRVSRKRRRMSGMSAYDEEILNGTGNGNGNGGVDGWIEVRSLGEGDMRRLELGLPRES